jgi:peptide/nickel transport system ATP-binding protein
VASTVADRIVVLYGGRVAEVGPARAVLDAPSHPYTAALLAARLGPHTVRDQPLPTLVGEPPDPRQPPPGCVFTPRCPHTTEVCETQQPVLQELPDPRRTVACLRSGELAGDAVRLRTRETWSPLPPSTSELAVQLRGVTKTFGRRGERHVAVDSLDLDVRKGSAVALVGESGCGKTTTLRIAVRLEQADSGIVEHGRGNPPQLVFQDAGASLTPWLRVGDMLEERLRVTGAGGAARRQQAQDTLTLVGLSSAVAMARPAELSGGQRQRVALARAVVVPPALLACDEPISALDVSLAAVVLNLLGRLRRELGMALLFVTHDLAAARVIADELVVMSAGQVVERGATEQVLDAPAHPCTRQLLAAIPGFGSDGSADGGR